MAPTVIAGAVGGVLAALVTLFGVLATSRWRIAEENILKQRAEWREAVRSLIGQAMVVNDRSAAQRIWAELALRLNPDDDPMKDDRELVILVRSLEDLENRNGHVRGRIVDLAAHILKHDWTRAKWEARGRVWEDEPRQVPLGLTNADVDVGERRHALDRARKGIGIR